MNQHTIFSGEDGLIIDSLLCVRHDVVDVLRGGDARLLAALVVPGVGAAAGARHVGARRRRAELRHRAVQQVYVLEQRQRCGWKQHVLYSSLNKTNLCG